MQHITRIIAIGFFIASFAPIFVSAATFFDIQKQRVGTLFSSEELIASLGKKIACFNFVRSFLRGITGSDIEGCGNSKLSFRSDSLKLTMSTLETTLITSNSDIITTTHRFEEGKMSGGWGPHLGHLLRAPDGTMWFADDTGNDVNINPAIAYYRQVNDKWSLVGTLPTYGTVQQNMGSVLGSNGIIYSYGIDVANQRVEECYFSTKQDYKACNLLPFVLKPNANYIGAALTPSGYQFVWWTNVAHEGGGTLQYIYNFGSGWNGPVTSWVGGYNDAAYIAVAFENDTHFVMNAGGVLGSAPNWNRIVMYGESDIGKPISNWQILSSGISDPITNTNDVWIDAAKGAHVLAQTKGVYDSTSTKGGFIVYFYRPKGGVLSPALAILPGWYRARFVDSDDGMIHLLYEGDDGSFRDLAYKKTDISGAIPWKSITPRILTLPENFGNIYAIYPESRIYQTAPVHGVNVALNGGTNKGNILYFQIQKGSIQSSSVSLVSSAESVAVGGYATLSLYTSQQNSCVISGGIYGLGQSTAMPTWSGWTGILTQPITFTVTCKDANGQSSSSSVTIMIRG